jgi:hypothetical protein
MASPSELFFKFIGQIQRYRRKIDPVIDGVERVRLLLDRLEQAEQAGSKIGQARLVLDAVDDSLNEIKADLGTSRASVSELAQMTGSLSPEEIKQLTEILSKRESERQNLE